MFTARYFCRRFFAARYWPKVGAAPSLFNPGWARNRNKRIGITYSQPVQK